MQLPEDFVRVTRQLMGETRFNSYLEAFEKEAPVSIRLNVTKGRFFCDILGDVTKEPSLCYMPVPWCAEGYYLEGRLQFTFDPLFHAGCYYVQEAASMFVTHVIKWIMENGQWKMETPLQMLDLCAAPGGKSTAMLSVLPEDCTLVSNEPIPTRAQILLENITKWGAKNCIVTNNYPRDFKKAKAKFDLILCDVPCSGEGMFRKDPATISEWSVQNVEKCWRLQREIVADAWECLNPGGIMIYSTCTFNTKENEENVRWIMEEYDAEVIDIPIDPSWHITGSLLDGFEAPVYRFIPGITRSEGLFVCALKKRGEWREVRGKRNDLRQLKCLSIDGMQELSTLRSAEGRLLPTGRKNSQLSTPTADLPYSEALRYLRGEAIVLPADAPRGIVTVTYKGFALGPVKNIGNRANNLYPKPWRIKTTHLPTEEVKIIDIQ